MDEWRKASQKEVGVGGIKCPCCVDDHDGKEFRRRTRQRLKVATRKLIKEQMNSGGD